MLTLKHNGKSYVNWEVDDLRAAGVPEAEIQAAEMKVRAGAISAECRRRIYAVASAESQMNMAAAVGVISSKAASARTDDEKAILAGAEAAIGWVAAMRAAVAALAAEGDADFTADAAWPDVPPEALAMIQHF